MMISVVVFMAFQSAIVLNETAKDYLIPAQLSGHGW
jgi:hypothetical protein